MADLDALRRAHDGMDACVHLAGDPWAGATGPGATWNSLLQTNIIGTYNVFVSALAARVQARDLRQQHPRGQRLPRRRAR